MGQDAPQRVIIAARINVIILVKEAVEEAVVVSVFLIAQDLASALVLEHVLSLAQEE